MKVVRSSITCIRYMPTLRVPVRGSRVMTAGSVMNGAGSPGPPELRVALGRGSNEPPLALEQRDPRAQVRGRRHRGKSTALELRGDSRCTSAVAALAALFASAALAAGYPPPSSQGLRPGSY